MLFWEFRNKKPHIIQNILYMYYTAMGLQICYNKNIIIWIKPIIKIIFHFNIKARIQQILVWKYVLSIIFAKRLICKNAFNFIIYQLMDILRGIVSFFYSGFKRHGGDCLASLISVAFQNHVISWSSCWSFLLMEITVVFHKLLFFTELNWVGAERQHCRHWEAPLP